MSHILDEIEIVAGILSADANADLAADYISLKNYRRCLILVTKPVGSAGDDVSLHVQQASDVLGTGVKDLAFGPKLWAKIGSGGGLPADQWTVTEYTTAAADIDTGAMPTGAPTADLGGDDQAAMFAVEVKADELDVDNGFDVIRCIIEGDDIGNAMIMSLHYVLMDPRYPQPTQLGVHAD